MADLVRVSVQGSGEWLDVEGGTASTTETAAILTVPISGELGARLTSGARRTYLIAVGDPDVPEGVEPEVWRGVVTSWRPQGELLRIDARAAASLEDLN